MKKLIAYSSVAHMGVVTIGIFTFNQQGLSGALFTMLAHGVVSGALFLCVGVLYDRVHSRDIARYGGVANIMPAYAAGVHALHHGLRRPAGALEFRRRVPGHRRRLEGEPLGRAAAPRSRMILGAAYMLFLYRRVAFGRITREDLRGAARPLAAGVRGVRAAGRSLTLWMGVYPQSFLDVLRGERRRTWCSATRRRSSASRLAGL